MVFIINERFYLLYIRPYLVLKCLFCTATVNHCLYTSIFFYLIEYVYVVFFLFHFLSQFFLYSLILFFILLWKLVQFLISFFFFKWWFQNLKRYSKINSTPPPPHIPKNPTTHNSRYMYIYLFKEGLIVVTIFRLCLPSDKKELRIKI